MGFVFDRRRQRVANGAQQCQACNRGDQLAGERRQHAGDGCTKHANQQVQRAANCRGGVALGGVGMRILAHADGSGDGAQAQRKRSKRGENQRGQTGQGDDFGDGHATCWATRLFTVTGRPNGRHAWQVLRGHRHHKQRQRQADGSRPRKTRRNKDRRGQIE